MTDTTMTAQRRVLSILEFCSAYGVCRSTAYREIQNGALKRAKIRNRVVIPVSEAEAWLKRKIM